MNTTNETHILMCPHCMAGNPLSEKSMTGPLYVCDTCGTAYSVIEVRGALMTICSSEDAEKVKAEFEAEFAEVPQSLFDAINVGRNRGAKIIFESTPGNAPDSNWIREAFKAPSKSIESIAKRIMEEVISNGNSTFRQETPDAILLICGCSDCIEELNKRSAADDCCNGSDCGVGFAEGEPLLAGMPTFGLDVNATSIENINSVPQLMREGANTYEERNKLYGDSYKQFGLMMKAMFPGGLFVKEVDDWNRLGVFVMLASKMTRYAANFNEGGHVDSARDNGVYSFMLEELTRLQKGEA